VRVEPIAIDDLHHLARLFHRSIPLRLRLRLRPGLLWRAPAREWIVRGDIPSDLRGDDEADAAPPEIGNRNNSIPAIGLVYEAASPLAGIEFGGGHPQVAVSLHRVHRQIKMGINRKHVHIPCL